MGWTDPGHLPPADHEPRRSRDEMLAEVLRRGGRIRTRRRTAMALAGVLALVLPVGAFVAMVPDADRAVNVTAAGTPLPSDPLPSTGADGLPADVTTTTVIEQGTEPAAPPSTTPVAPPTTVRAGAPATTTATTRPAIGATPTTTAPSGNSSSGPALTTPTTAQPAGLAVCPVADVRVTVSTGKATYAPGETVTGSSILENRSGVACLVSARGFFHIEDAAGRIVSNFAYTADFRMPVKAEPGQTFSSTFAWDQRNCSSNPCVQAPAGTYTAVAGWTEAAPYFGRGSFSISP